MPQKSVMYQRSFEFVLGGQFAFVVQGMNALALCTVGKYCTTGLPLHSDIFLVIFLLACTLCWVL